MDILNKRPFAKQARIIEDKFGKKFTQNIFYFAFAALLLLYAALYSLPSEISPKIVSILRMFRYAVCAVLIFKGTILCDRTLKQLLIMGAIIAFFFITSFRGHDATLFISFCTIYASRGTNFKTANAITCVGSASVIVIVLLLGKLGILPNYEVHRTDDIIRYSLGFAHPNAFGLWLMSACFAFCSAFGEKMKIRHFALIFLMGSAMFYFTNSRASFLCIASAAIMLPVCGTLIKKEQFAKGFPYICAAGIVSFCAFSIWSTLFYSGDSSDILVTLNDAFSGRLALSNEAYKLYGTSLLGSGAFAADLSVVVDNLYARIFVTSGAPAMLLFTFVQAASCLNAGKQRFYKTCFLSLLWSAYATMEVFSYVAVFNVTLLCFSASENETKQQ